MSLKIEKKLDSNWRLKLVEDTVLTGDIYSFDMLARYDGVVVEAQVPGDWPLDYVRAGLMAEPYMGANYLKICDYENCHVFYSVRFDWDSEPDRLTFLNFEGIDTVADVFLNGRKIGHAENMYIPYEMPADGLICGENELLVHIFPSGLVAREHSIGAGCIAQPYNYESMVIRKAAHMFGWDICPRIVSSGLWRPVSVIQKKPERVEDVFFRAVNIGPDGSASCLLTYDVDIGRNSIRSYEILIEGKCEESCFAFRQKLWYIHGSIEFTIPQARLWWPRGYGRPDQYDLTVTLLRDGEAVDVKKSRQGIRTVKLILDKYITDKEGEFCFVVNGKRIFIKGTNWVPADAFHSNDSKRIPNILSLVEDIGCNAIRIWGGGVYESDFFYDWCDENGIFVWQDFMMTCSIYPNDKRMQSQFEQEVYTQVRRLRRHVSICLWAGDNECDTFGCLFGRNPDDNPMTREILPRILNGEDMSRPYLPSSPYVDGEAFRMPGGGWGNTPEQHLWGPREYFKDAYYHDHKATFASEMGYHGCNSPQSIRKFIPEEFIWPPEDNAMWLYHAASPELNGRWTYRIALMSRQIEYVFTRKPDNLDEYARMSQICQAEAKKYFIESFRSQKGVRNGIIWWNIMDCWPQFSDAVVDYYYCRKLAYFYIRRSQQDLCLMMDDKPGDLFLYAVNDTQVEQRISYEIIDIDTDDVIAAGNSTIPSDESVVLQRITDDGQVHFYAIKWYKEDGTTGINHYLQGKPLYNFEWYMNCLKKVGFDEFEGF